MPPAAIARDRPTSPATATSVSTYGSASNSVPSVGLTLDTRSDIAFPNPNSRHAHSAPHGRHLPKIIAASAMNPRPSVMSLLNDPTKPTDRDAPPSAANRPAA